MADDSPNGIVQPEQEAKAQPAQSDSLTAQAQEPKAEETAQEVKAQPEKVPFTEMSPEDKLKATRQKLQEQGEEKNKAKKDYEEMARELATENPAAIEKIANKDYGLASKLSEELYDRPLGQLLGELYSPPKTQDFNSHLNKYLSEDDGIRRKECESDKELNDKLGRQFKLFKGLGSDQQTPEVLKEMLETARIAHLGKEGSARLAKTIIKESEERKAASISTGTTAGTQSSFAELTVDEFGKLSQPKKKEYMKKSLTEFGEVKFNS